MKAGTLVVFVLIVILLLGFGVTCQRSSVATRRRAKVRRHTWGGAVLFVLVVLMVVATVRSVRRPTPVDLTWTSWP